jgi:hypothetical protein
MTARPPSSRATVAAGKSTGRDRLLSDMARGRIVAALRTCFNFFTLNIALVLASVFVVTVPVALNAAMVALERWRADGEDRVVREFLTALRSGRPLRTTLAVGAPLAVMAVAAEEVHYFARGGSPVNWVCLGSGVAALLTALTSVGFVLLLGARHPSAPLPDLWSLSIRLALQNLVLTGPLFVVEFAGAILLGLLDPALVLIGLPLTFLFLVRMTSDFGARRAGYGRGVDVSA